MQNAPHFQTISTTIDAKVAGAFVIDTTHTAGRFYPMWATFEVIEADTVLTVPTVSIGTNATSYNNILTASVLTGLNTLNKFLNTSTLQTAVADSVAPNTAIRVNVVLGAAGGECQLRVMLHGFYF